ncbi:DUF4251 domain-containing protein [Marixanthomonas spongiae]|uniref:DUF4251 domain-containing protein n=1 Tax=Marixanthomonas spongiae TaxID=2174845 RepID=A0A2U0HWF8_9FLAO|nr:DUF4251 domain-containing protein [Marixanthomonas spongiae]PVW13202.1 hypothetical protein DDV96_13930 [Marixanthomonas spongiae]
MKTLLFLLPLLFISCGTAHDTSIAAHTNEVRQWANDKQFTIESQWATPQTGNRINLIGNANHLTFKNDTVSAYLPFFGERHSGNVFDGGAIEFEGVPKDLQTKYNQKKNAAIITFDISEKGEHYQVSVTLYGNKNSHISVNSSQRDFMGYDGRVSALSETEN